MRRLLIAVVVVGLAGLLGQASELVHSAHEQPARHQGHGIAVPVVPDPDHSEHGLAPGSGTGRQPAPVIATAPTVNVAGQLVYRDGDGVVRQAVLDYSGVSALRVVLLVFVVALTLVTLALMPSVSAREA